MSPDAQTLSARLACSIFLRWEEGDEGVSLIKNSKWFPFEFLHKIGHRIHDVDVVGAPNLLE